MPALIAPFIGFALGVLFAWAGALEIGRTGSRGLASRSLAVVTLFALLVFGPVTGYFLVLAPDWALTYLLDSNLAPTLFATTAVLAAVASVPLGFITAARPASMHRSAFVLRLGLGPVLTASIFIMLGLRRLSTHATFAQYHGNFGVRSIADTPLGYAVAYMLAVLAVATFIVWKSIRRLAYPNISTGTRFSPDRD